MYNQNTNEKIETEANSSSGDGQFQLIYQQFQNDISIFLKTFENQTNDDLKKQQNILVFLEKCSAYWQKLNDHSEYVEDEHIELLVKTLDEVLTLELIKRLLKDDMNTNLVLDGLYLYLACMEWYLKNNSEQSIETFQQFQSIAKKTQDMENTLLTKLNLSLKNHCEFLQIAIATHNILYHRFYELAITLVGFKQEIKLLLAEETNAIEKYLYVIEEEQLDLTHASDELIISILGGLNTLTTIFLIESATFQKKMTSETQRLNNNPIYDLILRFKIQLDNTLLAPKIWAYKFSTTLLNIRQEISAPKTNIKNLIECFEQLNTSVLPIIDKAIENISINEYHLLILIYCYFAKVVILNDLVIKS